MRFYHYPSPIDAFEDGSSLSVRVGDNSGEGGGDTETVDDSLNPSEMAAFALLEVLQAPASSNEAAESAHKTRAKRPADAFLEPTLTSLQKKRKTGRTGGCVILNGAGVGSM